MNGFILFLCTCQIITRINGYVLFAANLEDFRSVAKKFVPEKLANQLTEMASLTSKNFRNKKNAAAKPQPHVAILDASVSFENKSNRDNNKRFKIAERHEDITKNVNIDFLVKKIKSKLEHDLLQKQKSNNFNAPAVVVNKSIYKHKNIEPKLEEYIEEPEKNPIPTQKTVKNINYQAKPIEPQFQKKPLEPRFEDKNIEPQYEDKQIDPKFEDKDIYKSYNLEKRDSYDEYEIPNKDEERFEPNKKEIRFEKVHESIENQYYKPIEPEASIPVNTDRQMTFETNFKATFKDKVQNFDEVKAKTESLVYDEDEIVTVSSPKYSGIPKQTMIPTKKFFTMSSPNYYAKIPTVAERYDFNEPLPERDRELEVLKDIGNPRAVINGKIKV